MKRIRKGIFETNSSSTHALCIVKEDNKLEKPEKLKFDIYGDFGWSFEVFNSQSDKFTYLTIMALELGDEETKPYMINLIKALKEIGYKEIYSPERDDYSYIYTEKEIEEVADSLMKKWRSMDFRPYIDHIDSAYGFLIRLLNPENIEELKRFMLSSKSFITTGNDNDDRSIWSKPNREFNLKMKPYETTWDSTEYDSEDIEDRYYIYYKGN